MSNNLWQMGVARAAALGCRSACARVDEALKHGDVGFAQQAGSGELALFLNGVCYEPNDAGGVHMARGCERLCYCSVGQFDHYAPVFLSGDLSDLAELRKQLDGRREVVRARNHVQLMMATGTLGHAVISGISAPREATSAVRDDELNKAVFELENVTGSLVGRRAPGYLEPSQPAGWRFVFLSEGRTCMGRLLGASDLSLACQISSFDGIDLRLPASREFNDLALR